MEIKVFIQLIMINKINLIINFLKMKLIQILIF